MTLRVQWAVTGLDDDSTKTSVQSLLTLKILKGISNLCKSGETFKFCANDLNIETAHVSLLLLFNSKIS